MEGWDCDPCPPAHPLPPYTELLGGHSESFSEAAQTAMGKKRKLVVFFLILKLCFQFFFKLKIPSLFKVSKHDALKKQE